MLKEGGNSDITTTHNLSETQDTRAIWHFLVTLRIEKESKRNTKTNMVKTENSPRVFKQFETMSLMPAQKLYIATYLDQEELNYQNLYQNAIISTHFFQPATKKIIIIDCSISILFASSIIGIF